MDNMHLHFDGTTAMRAKKPQHVKDLLEANGITIRTPGVSADRYCAAIRDYLDGKSNEQEMWRKAMVR